MDGEAAVQDPSFTWEHLPNPRYKTVQILNNQRANLEKLMEMKRRAREYCNERKIVNQVRSVCKASKVASAHI